MLSFISAKSVLSIFLGTIAAIAVLAILWVVSTPFDLTYQLHKLKPDSELSIAAPGPEDLQVASGHLCSSLSDAFIARTKADVRQYAFSRGGSINSLDIFISGKSDVPGISLANFNLSANGSAANLLNLSANISKEKPELFFDILSIKENDTGEFSLKLSGKIVCVDP